MSNEDKNLITINLFVIGDEGVGKKTFISRINSMSCTHSHKNKNKFKPKEEKKPKKEEEEDENQDEIPKKKEPIYIPPPSSNQLEFKLGSITLTLQAFIIDGATECKIDEDVSSDDDDEEIVHEYHIKFSMTKRCILNYLRMLQSDNEKNINEDIFLFMYDLSDFTTFERMMLYYDSLNRKFKLNENKAKCIIIGNKSEKKMLYSKEDNEKIASFFKLDSNFKKFEISNKLHFNFSKFLNELIEGCVQGDVVYDKDKLKKILENKFTFNKAKRVGMETENDIPGPNQYNTDIYEFSSIEERNDILNDKKKRFTNKIFVNKQGPLFYTNKKEEERKKNEFEENKRKASKRSQFKSKTENNLNGNNAKNSYTMGGAPCKYNFKEERLKLIEKRNKEYMDAFGDNVLSSINQPFTLKNRDQKYFDEISNRRYQYQQNLLDERKNKMEKFLEMRDKNYEKLNQEYLAKSQNYKDRYKEYDEQKAKQRFLDVVYGNNSKFIARSNNHTEIKEMIKKENEKKYVPPQLYDIRGSLLNPKKGAIILGKRKYKDKEINNAPFVVAKSDFDKIVEKQKEFSNGYAPRYRDHVLKNIPEKPEKVFDEEKFERFKENQKLSERNERLQRFIDYSKARKERHDELMKSIKEEEDEFHKLLFRQYYKNNAEEMENYPPPVNYNQVEEKAPAFSIKGRHDHKKIRHDNSNNVNMNYFSINGRQIEVDHDNLPNPNINAIRWKVPAFTFGTEERFDFDKYNELIKNKQNIINEDEEKEKENKNPLADRSDFSKKSIYDSKSQRTGFDDSNKNNPGPGQYLVKGFADEIIEKYQKINNQKKLNELNKKDEKKKKKDEKQKTVTGTSINNYMDEFKDQRNEVPESREKSEIGEEIQNIRNETTEIETHQTEVKKEEEPKTEVNEVDDNLIEIKNEGPMKVEEVNMIENKDNNTKPEDPVQIKNDNKEEVEQENQIPDNNNTRPEDPVQIKNDGENKEEVVGYTEPQENNTKPEDPVQIKNDNKEEVVGYTEPQETNTKPDDPVQIKNDNKEEVVGYTEPQEINTKPEDPVQINNNGEEEINFEEPVEED